MSSAGRTQHAKLCSLSFTKLFNERHQSQRGVNFHRDHPLRQAAHRRWAVRGRRGPPRGEPARRPAQPADRSPPRPAPPAAAVAGAVAAGPAADGGDGGGGDCGAASPRRSPPPPRRRPDQRTRRLGRSRWRKVLPAVGISEPACQPRSRRRS